MKGLLIICVVLVLFLHINAVPQNRTENGITLTYENLAGVPQSTFQAYIDLFFQSYPAQCAKYNPNCPKHLTLVTNSSYDGAAKNAGEKITVGGDYAKANPTDIGFISHEGFHSVQGYPHGDPLWITEGLANYAGNEFYLGLQRLGKYKSSDHYSQKYDPAARFFVYLENTFPGIIKNVNSIMRNNTQADGQFWITLTGYTVDQLWDQYVQASATVCPNGNGVTTSNTATRDYALKLFNDKRSQIANGTFKMSNGAFAPAAKNMNKLTYSCEYEEAAQNYVNSCYNDSYRPDDATGLLIPFPWVVNSINDILTTSVPYLFAFDVVNQNGNAMRTQGTNIFPYLYAYDNASRIGCGYSTTPCPGSNSSIICFVGSWLPESSPVYSTGSKCTANSQCTRTTHPICDIQSGLCTAAPTPTPAPTTTTTTTTVQTTTTPSMPGCSNGNGITTWNNAARSHALKLINDKRSQIANGTFVMSNGAVAPAAKNMNKLTYSCEYETAAQNYFNTCNSSYLLSSTYDFSLGFPWVVNSINESLTIGVPYFFGFTVTNQNGNAILTDGSAHFAYNDAVAIGCGFTTTPCSTDIKTELLCMVGPVLPASSPVYAIGSKCTANSQCTKPESPICDIQSGLCYGTSTPAPTTLPTTTKSTTTIATTMVQTTATPSMPGCSNGNGITTWNNAARIYALKLINDKRSQIANGTFVMSNGAIAPAAKNMNKLTYSCEYETAAQNYFNTCNSSYLPSGTFGFSLGFPWVVNSINESLTIGVPYFFGFTVTNQNGNAILTDGSAHFAYNDAVAIGCGFTTTPCSTDIKTELFCMVGPVLPASSQVYAIGSKCTANSQCTKPESPICDIQSGLCYGTSTPATTTPKPITLTFYDDLIFGGESKAWTGSGNACDNFLSNTFNDRVESVNTGNGCVMLFEHRDCQGESVKLDPTCGLQQGCCPYHSSLAQDCKNFVNRASSHKLC